MADAELVALVARSDEHAFAELYRRYQPGVRALARRRVGDIDRADELTQEVFLDAWRSASRYDPQVAPVAAWLRTIAARRAVDHARRAAVRPLQHEGREESEAAREGELVARLDMIDELNGLPTAQRETLALAFYGDMTYPKIAERTGTPLGTIKSRALLGMRRLAATATP